MKIGNMTERITLRKPTQVSDGIGGQTVVYQDAKEIWASVQDFGGGLSLTAAQPVNDYSMNFQTFFENVYDVNENWHLVYRLNTYRIQAISKASRKIATIQATTTSQQVQEIYPHQ
jgi:SPP1 family predicted phage head-tail adaptor